MDGQIADHGRVISFLLSASRGTDTDRYSQAVLDYSNDMALRGVMVGEVADQELDWMLAEQLIDWFEDSDCTAAGLARGAILVAAFTKSRPHARFEVAWRTVDTWGAQAPPPQAQAFTDDVAAEFDASIPDEAYDVGPHWVDIIPPLDTSASLSSRGPGARGHSNVDQFDLLEKLEPSYKGGAWRDSKGRYIDKATAVKAGLEWKRVKKPLKKEPDAQQDEEPEPEVVPQDLDVLTTHCWRRRFNKKS